MPPKQRWELVPGSVPASTMEDAKKQLRTFNDLGKNPKCEWNRWGGGTAAREQYFSCGAHVDCPVKLKVYTMGGVFLMAKLRGKKLTKNSVSVRIQTHSNAFERIECIFPDCLHPLLHTPPGLHVDA